MSNFEKLRLTKALLRSVAEAGFTAPTLLQSKIFSRINGGQDLVVIAPENTGKSTAIVLAALNKIKNQEEIAPQILILAPDAEKVQALMAQFEQLNHNKSLRVYGLYTGGGHLDTQVLELTDGVDIVIATPDRARAIYLKLGLNLNKIHLFIVDDADLMVKAGLQLPLTELSRGLRKSQRLLFSTTYDQREDKMTEALFEEEPALIDWEDFAMEQSAYAELLYYPVPDEQYKLKVLHFLLSDKDVFNHTAIVVDSAATQQLVSDFLKGKEYKATKAPVETYFSDGSEVRLIHYSHSEMADFSEFPALIYFEIPLQSEVFLKTVVNNPSEEQLSILLVTANELSRLLPLEESHALKFTELELPEEL